jgi:hypothetical protein
MVVILDYLNRVMEIVVAFQEYGYIVGTN